MLTVIGTPALAFNGNLGFLQVVLGYLLARIVISVLFLPQYFRGEMYTAYELMERRFGTRLRKLTAGLFLILRALAEGVRVFAISIVIAIVLGTGEVASIAVIVCLTLLYTFEGECQRSSGPTLFRCFLYIGGAIVSLVRHSRPVHGGWEHVVDVAAAGQIPGFRFSVPFRRSSSHEPTVSGPGSSAALSSQLRAMERNS